MTTFFRTNNARGAVDCWSEAVAAYRTDEILKIRRVHHDEAENAGDSAVLRLPVTHLCHSTEHVVDRDPRPVVAVGP
jgi:hypothetical protein